MKKVDKSKVEWFAENISRFRDDLAYWDTRKDVYEEIGELETWKKIREMIFKALEKAITE